VLVEKTPQYPVYSLPFKGQTVYAEKFSKAKEHHGSERPSSAATSHMQ
jgi:hypothetical protein